LFIGGGMSALKNQMLSKAGGTKKTLIKMRIREKLETEEFLSICPTHNKT
jgi:hypothetical protein